MNKDFSGVSPTVALFMSGIRHVQFDEEIRMRRACIKRSYLDFLSSIDVNIKLAPIEFYQQVVAYLNTVAGREVVTLSSQSGIGYLEGCHIPEFMTEDFNYKPPLQEFKAACNNSQTVEVYVDLSTQ